MIDLPDAIVAVGDEEIPDGVHRDARGMVEFGGGGRTAVAAVARDAIAGDGGDHAGGVIDLADPVVANMSAMNRSPAASTATPGAVESGGGGRAAVAAVAQVPLPATVVMMPVARLTSRIRLLLVSAMKRSPAASTATPVGAVQVGGGGRAAVAAVAMRSIAGDGGDHAGGVIDLADPVVAVVGDEEVAGGVHRDAYRAGQVGGGGRAAVAAVARGCRCRPRW